MTKNRENSTPSDAALERYYQIDSSDHQAVDEGAEEVLREIKAEVQHYTRGINSGIIPFLLEQFRTNKRS